MNKRNLELMVGSFIFAGLLVFAMMVIRFGSYDEFRDSYRLTAIFRFTNGVIIGAPVRVAGVEAGRVEDLVLTPDEQAKVGIVMEISRKVTLRKNAKVIINSLGIMGEKYVEFLPQTPDAEILKPGDTIEGVDPIALEAITAEAYNIVNSVKGIFADEATGNKLQKIVDNIVSITGEPNQDNVKTTLANFRQFSDRMNNFGTELEDISKDRKLSQTIDNFREASASLKAIFGQVQSGEGTMGQLIYKTDLYDKMKQFMKDLVENPSKLLRPVKDKDKGKGKSLFSK